MEEHTEHHGHGALTVLYSFVFGALAGAAVATLFAPARGRETREKLLAKAREGRGEVTERGRAALDRTRTLVSEEARRASRLVAEGRVALADLRERGGQALEHVRHEAAGAVTDVKAAYEDVRTEIKGARDK